MNWNGYVSELSVLPIFLVLILPWWMMSFCPVSFSLFPYIFLWKGRKFQLLGFVLFLKADLLLPFFSCCLVAPCFVSASSQPVARQDGRLCSAGADDCSTLSFQRWTSSDSPGQTNMQAAKLSSGSASFPHTSSHLCSPSSYQEPTGILMLSTRFL